MEALCVYLGSEIQVPLCECMQWQSQAWASPAIARVKFWSIVVIAYGNLAVEYSMHVDCPAVTWQL